MSVAQFPTTRPAAMPTRDCAGCTRGLTPFTVPHFVAWAGEVTLDNGKVWAPEDFQLAFLDDVFSGRPEAVLIVPVGNGKTTLLGGLALYHLEHRGDDAYVPVAAASRFQAETLYRQAEGMVRRSPRLRLVFKCQPGHRRIMVVGKEHLRIQVYAADKETADSLIFSLAILDEGHRQKDMGLYETWRGKTGKVGGQVVMISTAGSPGGPFETLRSAIRDGSELTEHRTCFSRFVSVGLVLHEWALPADGDPEDLELVKQANPFSGITAAALGAEWSSPTMTLAYWKRYRCNIPSREGEQAITPQEWAAMLVEDEIPEGEPIWLGFDGAFKLDSCAMVPFWPRDSDFRLLGPATVLIPPRDGGIHPNEIKQALREINDRNPIAVVVMDPTFMHEIAAWIVDELRVPEVIEQPQTNPQAALDFERFMEGIAHEQIKHTGDEVLSRQVLNGVAKMLDSGRHKFERPHAGRQVREAEAESRYIDALDAAAMVHSVYAASLGDETDTIEVS